MPKELKRTQKEYLEGKLVEYTFQPTVNQNYAYVTAPPVSNKEVRALDYQISKVQKEMAECNFKPTLTAKPYRAGKVARAPEVQVNGLQRFYELRDL